MLDYNLNAQIKVLYDLLTSLWVAPTMNRKFIATVVVQNGFEAQERSAANFMTHSVDVARSSYQHLRSTGRAVEAFTNLQNVAVNKPQKRKRTLIFTLKKRT